MSGAAGDAAAPRPYNLVAELTYRCPLRCAYCSNPLDYREAREALDGGAWSRVFREAAALGCVHAGLTGGEPTLHPDLPEIVAGAAAAGLYTHLVTAGTTLDEGGLDALVEAGLRSVQLSVQDVTAEASDRIAGAEGFERKLAFAAAVRGRGLPLALNVVLHRENLARVPEMVALARRLDAHRLELANTQFHGWALLNRKALLPGREQLAAASRAVEAARRQAGTPEIVFVLPDYWTDRPKPCMGGWGRRIAVVDPTGRVLPCHAAASLPGLEFWKANERGFAACWADSPGMNAFRGEAWMPEPCRSCDERDRDFGGCRCQAFALTGDAAATDPACALAPAHAVVREARATPDAGALVYRGEPLPDQPRYSG
jgi:pyrroloquinoline quinone biosynthesis protein E